MNFRKKKASFSIEYILIIVLVILALVLALKLFGGNLSTTIGKAGDTISLKADDAIGHWNSNSGGHGSGSETGGNTNPSSGTGTGTGSGSGSGTGTTTGGETGAGGGSTTGGETESPSIPTDPEPLYMVIPVKITSSSEIGYVDNRPYTVAIYETNNNNSIANSFEVNSGSTGYVYAKITKPGKYVFDINLPQKINNQNVNNYSDATVPYTTKQKINLNVINNNNVLSVTGTSQSSGDYSSVTWYSGALPASITNSFTPIAPFSFEIKIKDEQFGVLGTRSQIDGKIDFKEYDSIIFDKVLPDGTTGVDLSLYENNSVIAYTKNNILHIGSPYGKVKAPQNSSNLFSNISNFNTLNVKELDTSNTTNMNYMFDSISRNDSTFTLDLSTWDTSNVVSMQGMFGSSGQQSAEFNLDLSSWDVSKVTDMSWMFYASGQNSTTYNLNLSNWNTSSLENTEMMFSDSGCLKATSWVVTGLDTWNMSKVTNTSNMFNNAGSKAQVWSIGNLSSWNVSSIVDMNSMFNAAGASATEWNIGDISSWNTKNVQNMNSTFNRVGATKLDLSGWNTSNVTSMSSLFANSKITLLDLSNWDTSKVKNMTSMFNSSLLTTIYTSADFVTDNVVGTNSMFHCQNIVGGNGTKYSTSHENNKDYARIDTQETPGYFTRTLYWNIDTDNTLTISHTPSNTELSGKYYEGELPWSSYGEELLKIVVGSEDDIVTLKTVEDVLGGGYSSFLANYPKLKTIDITNFDSHLITDMSKMFAYDKKINQIIGLENLNTSNVTNMSKMFAGCPYPTEYNLTNFNTSKVTDMSDMFNGCTNLQKIIVGDFDVSSVINSENMFYGCNNLKGSAGSYCSIIKIYDITAAHEDSSVNPGYFTKAIFWGIEDNVLTISNNPLSTPIKGNIINGSYTRPWLDYIPDIERINVGTSSSDIVVLKGMRGLFGNDLKTYEGYSGTIDYPKLTTIDLTYLDSSNITNMYGLFNGDINLTTIIGIEDLDVSNVTDMSSMFSKTAITSIDVSKWNTSKLETVTNWFRDCLSLEEVIGFNKLDLSNVEATTYMRTFEGAKSLKSIELPNSLTGLGGYWFSDCSSLESVTLGSGITKIGLSVFESTAITSITLPNTLVSIGSSAFKKTALTSITIPSNVETIGSSAFYECKSLETVSMETSKVTEIKEMTFQNCSALESISLPTNLLTIGRQAFTFCAALSELHVPSTVTSIGTQAFSNVPHVYYDGEATGAPWNAKALN